MFVYELKKLLNQAMLSLDTFTREHLLLHQFLSGLPDTVSRQLRATGEMKNLQTATADDCTRLLMALNESQQTAAVASSTNEVEDLNEQIARLTEQVETLDASPSRHSMEGQQCGRPLLCFFHCNRVGHIQRECPFRQPQTHHCFLCDR